ncbi:BREX system ATP-binding protein BrxD [Microterricola viridarii]|uniref:ATP-binding protein n=1 Tax=Microterricola viridarii TaxID=412690 RepID=A0A0X8E2D4_9MICO|nr:BREX system ATP-binding protein BrxD [Microterricola viridarii]AMB59184.1 ATP-binding protein [Microterricola viridarii]
MAVSPRRRQEIVDALRRGTVPQRGLDVMAVGLDRFGATIKAELQVVANSGAQFKAVRGEYGSGKTFFARWLSETAKTQEFATAEIQISETETPLHKLETVYRRIIESISTASARPSAFKEIIDNWFFNLQGDVVEAGVDASDRDAVAAATDDLIAKRLANVSKTAPAFAAALRGYRVAVERGEGAEAEGLLAWLGGQPHVASSLRRYAGVKGELDHFGALGFLQGLLTVLRDSGYSGLVVILDEVETLQRVRSDVREKSLNSLRQLLDEVDAGRFPGLYLLITGTPAFYDGQQGVQRLPPLAQRLETKFETNARYDNPRAPQLRLTGFTHESLHELGVRIRDLYADGAENGGRVALTIDNDFITDFAAKIAGQLGGKVGVAPRVFLRQLVDVMDKVDLHADFDPRREALGEVGALVGLTEEETAAIRRGDVRAGAPTNVDDIDLPL